MQLIKYFLTIFIASGLIIWGVLWFTNKCLKRSQVDFYGKMNAASDSMKKTELLIIGSSRALVNLDTRILDSVTGLRSYNYALNAVTIKTCLNMIKYVIHYQKLAKIILLNIDCTMFDYSRDPYKDAYYYPFEKNLPDFLMTGPKSNKLIHKLNLFDISFYDDFVKYAAIDVWARPGRKLAGFFNGYYPHQNLNDFTKPKENIFQKKKIPSTEAGFGMLNDIVTLCKKNNIKLLFVEAPYFKIYFPGNYYTNYYQIMEKVNLVAKQNDILFFNYTSLPMANDRTYFYDAHHLNRKGAEFYSAIVADTIKNSTVNN